MQLRNDLNDLIKMNRCSKTEQLVIQYILQCPDKIGHMSSRQLAKEAFTRPTTIGNYIISDIRPICNGFTFLHFVLKKL